MKLHFSLLSFLIACGGESVIEKQQNSAPVIMIGSHSPDAEILEGYEETFRASVSDDNNTYDELMVAWYVGENIVCDWETVSPAGESFCDIVFSDEDNNVIAEVRDPDGAGGRAEISVVVIPTDAPTAEILSPLQNTNHYSDQLILFSGIVGDAEDNPEDLIVTWTSSLDGELILDTTPNSTGEISDYGYLTQGQHALELRVEDTSGKVTKEQLVIQVGSANESPSCEIIAPSSQSTFIVGDEVIFQGTATDANVDTTELDVSFSSDRDGTLGTGNLASNGDVTFITDALSNNAHVITMTVLDEVGATCQATTIVHIGTPPVVNIEQPLDGDIFSLGEDVYFHGTASDNEDEMNALIVDWSSNTLGSLSTGSPSSQGSHQFTTSALTAGTHYISFSSTDTTGLVSTDTVTIQINTPPNAPTLSLSPDPITSSDVLTVNITSGGDDDGDPVTHNVEWFENGTLQSNTGNAVPATDLTFGDIWMARVTPNDGYTDGTLSEVSIVVGNSLPTVTTPVITSSAGSMYNDATLTCSATALDADQTVTPTFSWTVNGNTYNGSTLDLSTTAAAVGDQITCSVSVMDNQGAMASDASNVTLLNRSPILSQVQINPTTPSSIDTLTCVPTSSDADGETLTTTYDWTISGNSVGSASTLNLTSISINPTDTVECTVTVEDPSGATDTMSGTTTIINTAPSISNLTLNPAEPTLSDTLSCMASVTDIDGENTTVTYTFTNLMSGTVYTPTTSSSTQATLNLTSVTANFEDVIECSVTATDGYGGSTTDTTQVTIINTSPVFDTPATITPSTVEIGTAVTCSSVASDPDDGVASLSYVWNINGVQVSTGPGWTVNSTDASVGDNISCTAVAIDYTGNSTTSTSASITISNTAPVVSNVTLDNTSPYTNDTIGVSPTTFDFNGDSVTLQFEWHVIDASNGGTDTIVYTGNNPAFTNLDGSQSYGFDKGDEVYVIVTPNDGNDNGASVESDHAFVLNSAPSSPIVAVTSTTNPPLEGVDDLTCAITSTSSDPDGDSIDYTYSWYDPNGTTAQISPSTTNLTNVFPGGSTTPGLWECDVTASDGTDTASGSSDIEVDADWAGPLEFTNCGKTGRTGPSQSQCDTEYTGTTLDGLVTVTSGFQYWVVPSSGTYQITAYGAQGGYGANSTTTRGLGLPGGLGAEIQGNIALTEGDTVVIVVGQEGTDGIGNGNCGGGGGGGTFVWNNDTSLLYVAAGGGGGGPGSFWSISSTIHGQAGIAGATPPASNSYTSGSGGNFGQGGNAGSSGGNTSCGYCGAGGAGWMTDGGSGGLYGNNRGLSRAGGFLGGIANNNQTNGGFGGGAATGDDGRSNYSHGNAGGGGFSGGGGTGYPYFGGGGGSYNSGSNASNTSGVNTGHGYVIIDKL